MARLGVGRRGDALHPPSDEDVFAARLAELEHGRGGVAEEVQSDLDPVAQDGAEPEQGPHLLGVHVEEHSGQRVQHVRMVLCQTRGVVQLRVGAVGGRNGGGGARGAGVVLCSPSDDDALGHTGGGR